MLDPIPPPTRRISERIRETHRLTRIEIFLDFDPIWPGWTDQKKQGADSSASPVQSPPAQPPE